MPEITPKRDVFSPGPWLFLAFILLSVGALNLFRASLKPFWFDEILTWAASQAPKGILDALQNGADTSTPGFLLLEKWAAGFSTNEHIGFRWISVAAGLFASLSLYILVRDLLTSRAGLVAAVIPLLTSLQSYYAIEARGYALLVLFSSTAWLFWRRGDRAGGWLLLALSLGLAISSHYFAVLVFVPLAAGELLVWQRLGQIRWRMLLGFLLGIAPLAGYWPWLQTIRKVFGTNFWSKPEIVKIPAYYDALVDRGFGTGSGLALTLGVGLLGILWASWRARKDSELKETARFRVEDIVVALLFLALPLVGLILTKLMGGGYTPRYALPMVLGFAVSGAMLANWMGSRAETLLLIAVLSIFGFDQARFVVQNRNATMGAAKLPEWALAEASSRKLPLVISNATRFLELAYYNRDVQPFITVVDPRAAIQQIGTDNLDLNLLNLRGYLKADIRHSADFLGENTNFLLYSINGDSWNWWPDKFRAEGRRLTPIAVGPNDVLFLVN